MLNAAQGQALKTAGMQLALDYSGDWQDEVIAELRAWIAKEKAMGMRTMTVEAFRAQAKAVPPSHKCWGNVPRMACKAGLIAPTDTYQRAVSVATHAHPVKVWAIA